MTASCWGRVGGPALSGCVDFAGRMLAVEARVVAISSSPCQLAAAAWQPGAVWRVQSNAVAKQQAACGDSAASHAHDAVQVHCTELACCESAKL